MDPEFHDHCSPLPEPALEIIDLPISPLPVRCLAEALDPLHEDSSVPAPVKDRDVSVLRKPLPEAPEKVALFFLGRGARDRMDDIAPRIQCGGKALDIPSFPRGIPALIGDEERNPVQIEAVVIFRETLLLPFQGCSVLRLVQLYGEIGFRKGGHRDKAIISRIDMLRRDLPRRPLPGKPRELFLHGGEQCAENPDSRRPPVHSGKDMPGGGGGVCVLQHEIIALLVPAVMMHLLPVRLRHPPGGIRIFGELGKALFHLLFWEVEEKLQDEIAIVRERPFETENVVHVRAVFLLRDPVFQPERRYLLIPGAIHDRELSLLRNRLPVAPEHGIAELCLRGRLRIHNREPAGIEILDELLNHEPLSRTAPSLKEDNDGEPGRTKRRIQRGERPLKPLDLRAVNFLGELFLKIYFFQQVRPPFSSVPPGGKRCIPHRASPWSFGFWPLK